MSSMEMKRLAKKRADEDKAKTKIEYGELELTPTNVEAGDSTVSEYKKPEDVRSHEMKKEASKQKSGDLAAFVRLMKLLEEARKSK